MENDDDAGEAVSAATTGGAAQEFAAEAMRLRIRAQIKYAEEALDRLYVIAMQDPAGPLQVSALRELTEQLLGRPMPAVGPPAKQNEDPLAATAAIGAGWRKKLVRILESGAAERADGHSK